MTLCTSNISAPKTDIKLSSGKVSQAWHLSTSKVCQACSIKNDTYISDCTDAMADAYPANDQDGDMGVE